MTTPVVEGLERLANRLALLTSDDGEAEAAARAAGQLARRLGLSGGQLKAIFLAGVRAAGVPMPVTEAETAGLARDARDRAAAAEAEELRRLLDDTDDDLTRTRRLHDGLVAENEALRDALDRARLSLKVLRIACLVVVAAVALGGSVAWFAPALHLPDFAMAPAGSPLQRMAVAGPAGASLYGQPDRAAQRLGTAPAGARLPVRQLLWRGFTQWIETEVGGQIAFTPATEVDLR